MNMKRRWFLMAGLGALLWGTSVFADAPSEAPPPPPAPPETTAVSDNETAPVPEIDRDPFVSGLPRKVIPVGVTQATPEGPTHKAFVADQFKVTGMVWGIEKAKAIINDQIVGVGDVINEATIKRIDKEGILVEFDGQEYLLKRESGG